MKIIKQKLTSRKFWLGAAVLIVGIALCCCGDLANGMTLISIGCLSYLGAEGLVDIFRIVFSCSLFNEQVTAEREKAAAEEIAEASNAAKNAENNLTDTEAYPYVSGKENAI